MRDTMTKFSELGKSSTGFGKLRVIEESAKSIDDEETNEIKDGVCVARIHPQNG